MNMDKSIAKVISKCYSGKASIKDISFLLNNLLKQTTLGKFVEQKLPNLNLTMENKTEGLLVTLGEYSNVNSTIYINNALVERSRKGIGRGLAQLFDTYGHEMTHHWQHLIGSINRQSIPNYDKETVKGMCKIVGLDVNEEICKNIAHANYLKQPHEIEARDGGALFAVEVFQSILKNEYLTPEIREKVLSDLEFANENLMEHEKKNEPYYEQYEKFMAFFKSRNIKNFSVNKKVESFISCHNAFELWSNQNDPETLCRSYLTLIGSGLEYGYVRNMLIQRIKSPDFPEETRNRMIDSIVSTLKKGELEDMYYENALVDILEDEHLFEIYETLFVNNVEKLGATLFLSMEWEEKYAPAIGKIIVDNLEKVKINSEKDVISVYRKVENVLAFQNIDIPDELKKQLNDIKEKLESKVQIPKVNKR